MPFRPRQRIKPAPVFSCVLPQVKTHEDGAVTIEYVDESKFKLPSPETTRLRDLLDAGIDLKKVNTKLFSPSEIVTDLTEPQTTPEVNDEN